MWELFDYKTVQPGANISFLSSRKQHQFDCAEERMRVHAATWFSGNMGNGKVVFNNREFFCGNIMLCVLFPSH
jgi:hypothetical protein